MLVRVKGASVLYYKQIVFQNANLTCICSVSVACISVACFMPVLVLFSYVRILVSR